MCIALCAYLWRTQGNRVFESLSPVEATKLQNRIYKRAAALLLILGAGGGFLPSLLMFAKSGQVWSVNHQAPRSIVDQYLLMHIPLAVIWALLVAVQLWSGQVAGRRQLHIRLGWLTLAAGVIVIGGWVWPLSMTFRKALTAPTRVLGSTP